MDVKLRREYYRSSGTDACRFCCILVMTILVLLVISLVVLFLVLKPKKPEFTLENVQVVSFRVEQPPPLTTSGMEVFLSMNLELALAARNPNKVGIRYSTTRIYIYYRGNMVGLAVVPPFYQPSHSRISVQASLVVDRVNLLQSDASDLLRDAMNGVVTLVLDGKVPAQVKLLGIYTPRLRVGITCQIVVSPSQQQLVNKQCGVKNVKLD